MSEQWDQVTKTEEVSWAIFEVNGESVVGAGTGSGLSSFAQSFDDAKIQWGVIRVVGVDEQDNVTSRRPKFVQVNWVGPRVPAMKRMGALSGKAHVTALLKGVQVTIDSNDRADINAHTIGKALLQCGGAHKPTRYEFSADESIPLSELGYN